MQIRTSQPFSAAMAVMRSMRYGSVCGMAFDATITSWSMLATAGREKTLRRGSMASTMPSVPDTVISTRSPTSGETPSLRKRPRARQVTIPSPVST